ncbi:MAG: transcriptional regulator, family [Neobacillus sp.]|jgi:transcriptional regulator with XRE-family HTH domain|nr:transcriptional regulator, family [Neobacillus sp.]
MENDTINETFGKRLKKLRDDRGLYQEDIGEWFNMRKSTVSQWESGRLPHASIIAQLARKFNVATDYLLGLSDNERSVETIAAHRTDDLMNDLPPEALERIEEFKELMRLKYGKKPT